MDSRTGTNSHLIRCGKAIEEIQYPFMMKGLENLRIQGTHLSLTKTVYSMPTANIMLNGEKLESFSLKSGI